MKPLIGISAGKRIEGSRAPTVLGVQETYLESILKAGGVPIILPLTDDLRSVRQIYELCAGVLLPGGEDVNPARYSEPLHPSVTQISDLRDSLELELARWADRDNKPLLGVCRGLQVMNVALGGSLYQDIDSQAGSTLHKERKVADSWRALVHSISLVPGTHLHNIFELPELRVNSLHHQAVKDLAPGLIVTATAPDGIIEGIEDPAKRFWMGIQCHPEVLWPATEPKWLQLFEHFVAAASGAHYSGPQ